MTRPELTYQDTLDAARRILETCLVGSMTTVDAQGMPHTRQMAAVPQDSELTRLMSVAARGSRKLDHLAGNAKVCWLFADRHDNEVVTLTGTMRILEDQTLAEPAWQQLERAARQYSMNLLSEPENLWFVGLETRVETLEYMHPSAGLTHPVIYPIHHA
ncbi:MAG: pyridoxamine 5'-phosphate oxidase family protein [Phycisphaerales bacterium JB063]